MNHMMNVQGSDVEQMLICLSKLPSNGKNARIGCFKFLENPKGLNEGNCQYSVAKYLESDRPVASKYDVLFPETTFVSMTDNGLMRAREIPKAGKMDNLIYKICNYRKNNWMAIAVYIVSALALLKN